MNFRSRIIRISKTVPICIDHIDRATHYEGYME
jgi:hypothetical protein